MPPLHIRRRLQAGFELQQDGSAHACVWAPACRTVDIVLLGAPSEEQRIVPLEREADGYYSGTLEGVAAGMRYWVRLDGKRLRPDPLSRFQPEGPHGPSLVVDASMFRWTDQAWTGVPRDRQVIYEMHIGTFTPEGTWRAAMEKLPDLADLGITIVEMMPVAEFAGRFGWGYDGVALYAPTHLYGSPDDLRAFVDSAHSLRMGVILDVVYNHLGPDGNYLHEFSPDYFTDKYANDWGKAINFEGPAPAREFFVGNAGYWIDEYHFDGLRLDATQDIHDASPEHVLASIVERARAAGGMRQIYVVAENEPQDATLVRPSDEGGHGMDAMWNDDFHHTAVVALTGRREAYYTDYTGSPQEFVSAAKYGFLYQGQWYAWQKQRRGAPAKDIARHSFVTYLENHDQVANSAFGRRLRQLSGPGRMRALTALTLLGPGTPMLFQGQEFASTAPFRYFSDHREELRQSIREGRREFLAQFASLRDPDVLGRLPSPVDEETFLDCKLDWAERVRHRSWVSLHRDLLSVRRDDPVIARLDVAQIDGAVLNASAFVLRYTVEDDDRLLLVNLGPDVDLTPVPEPLLGLPRTLQWKIIWSSESPDYGGQGVPAPMVKGVWHVPGESAVLLRPEPVPDGDATKTR